jgi:hypothetical protein
MGVLISLWGCDSTFVHHCLALDYSQKPIGAVVARALLFEKNPEGLI